MELNELVTKTKLIKLHNMFMEKVGNDPQIKHRMMELDWSDDYTVESFCKECFGEPKGLYINTMDEQKKLLRRIYDDHHKQSGGNFMRQEFLPMEF